MGNDSAAVAYEPPSITYHGKVGELTLSHHLVVGSKVVGLAAAFAASTGNVNPPSGGGGNVVNTPVPVGPDNVTPGPGTGTGPGTVTNNVHGPTTNVTHVTRGVGGESASGVPGGAGGGAGGAHGAGSGGGGGKELPFTGLAVITVAGVGAALASAGGVIRRVTGRGDQAA